jgi:hypothetical protein
MSTRIKNERLRRYQKLSLTKRIKVNQMVERYTKACAALEIEPEIDAAFREAIDMVVKGKWEPDQPWERLEPHRQYGIYTPPHQE